MKGRLGEENEKNNRNRNRNKEIDTIEHKESFGNSIFQGFLLSIDRRKWV